MILFLSIHVCYRYNSYTNNFNNPKIEELSNALSVPVFNYITQFENKDLCDSKNFEDMIKWVTKNYYVLEEYSDLLDSGHEIKYHKKSDKYLFCLYGEDKISSSNNISIIEGLDENGLFSKKKPSFLQYYFNYSDYDIVLFGYSPFPPL